MSQAVEYEVTGVLLVETTFAQLMQHFGRGVPLYSALALVADSLMGRDNDAFRDAGTIIAEYIFEALKVINRTYPRLNSQILNQQIAHYRALNRLPPLTPNLDEGES